MVQEVLQNFTQIKNCNPSNFSSLVSPGYLVDKSTRLLNSFQGHKFLLIYYSCLPTTQFDLQSSFRVHHVFIDILINFIYFKNLFHKTIITTFLITF